MTFLPAVSVTTTFAVPGATPVTVKTEPASVAVALVSASLLTLYEPEPPDTVVVRELVLPLTTVKLAPESTESATGGKGGKAGTVKFAEVTSPRGVVNLTLICVPPVQGTPPDPE